MEAIWLTVTIGNILLAVSLGVIGINLLEQPMTTTALMFVFPAAATIVKFTWGVS